MGEEQPSVGEDDDLMCEDSAGPLQGGRQSGMAQAARLADLGCLGVLQLASARIDGRRQASHCSTRLCAGDSRGSSAFSEGALLQRLRLVLLVGEGDVQCYCGEASGDEEVGSEKSRPTLEGGWISAMAEARDF